MIYHCIPELREVVYANTLEKLSGQIEDYNISRAKRIKAVFGKMVPQRAHQYLKTVQSKNTSISNFEYSLLCDKGKLFTELNEILHSVSELSELIDVVKCERFLENCRNGIIHTNSLTKEAELIGSLATACYWFKNVRGL